MRKKLTILAIALAVAVAEYDGARAESPALEVGTARSFSIGGDVMYSVKFLCGRLAAALPLALGVYLTAITIHNLNPTGGPTNGTASDGPEFRRTPSRCDSRRCQHDERQELKNRREMSPSGLSAFRMVDDTGLEPVTPGM